RCMIVALVDKLFEHLKERLYVGEIVTTTFRANKSTPVKVISVVTRQPTHQTGATVKEIPSKRVAVETSNSEPLTAVTSVGSAALTPAQLRYMVHCCDADGELILEDGCDLDETIERGMLRFEVRADQCRRARNIFNKANIRWFVNESAERGASAFSYWVVKDQLVKKYSLSTEPPVVKRVRKVRRGDFPMDDLELLDFAPRPTPPTRPIPSSDFGSLPPEFTPKLIETWNFLAIFEKPLKLAPFALQDYTHALEVNSPQKCLLIDETMASLLTQACQIHMAGMTLQQHHNNSSSGHIFRNTLTATNNCVYSNFQPLSIPASQTSAVAATVIAETSLVNDEHHYNLFVHKFSSLSDLERLAIDQWYKWSPGKWARTVTPVTAITAAPTTKQRTARVDESFASFERLRAWELALMGFIRDCVDEDAVCGGKWRVLAVLIGAIDVPMEDVQEVDEEEEAEEEKAELEEQQEVGEQKEEKISQENGNGMKHQESNSIKMSHDDDNEDDCSDDNHDSQLVVNGGKRHKLDESEYGATSSDRRSSRRKRRKVDSYYQPNETTPEDDEDEDVDDNFANESPDEEQKEQVESRRSFRRNSRRQEDGGSKELHGIGGRNTRASALAASQALSAAIASSTDSSPPLVSFEESVASITASTNGEAVNGDKASRNLNSSNDSINNGDAKAVETATGLSVAVVAPKKGRAVAVKLDSSSMAEMGELLATTSRGFASLSAKEKLSIIWILCDQYACQSNAIRLHNEAMHDKLADIKKFKRENFGKEQRAVAVARYAYDEKLKLIQQNEQPDHQEIEIDGADPALLLNTNDPASEEDLDEAHISTSALRMRRLRKEQAKKKEREQRQREQANRAKLEKKERDREHRLLAEEGKKIKEMERAFYQKVVNNEVEHALASAVSRMTPLGIDRNYRKYWWFDYYHGLTPVKKMPAEVDHWEMCPFQKLGFSAGVLLVEDVNLESSSREELEQGIAQPKSWSYFSTIDEVEQLLESLDLRGIREQNLAEGIRKCKDIIEAGMLKRKERTETSHLIYKNGWHENIRK
ncbi:hypothetical protein HK100_009588, partial [Physocladia obscura]